MPSDLLTGQEGVNAPKGCLELDPAALPILLLQVATEAPIEKCFGDTMGPRQNAKESEKVEMFQKGKRFDCV